MSIYTATTFRTLGAAALTHNLFTIENGASSGVKIELQRLVMLMDATGVLTAVMPLVRISRITTLPTGGTTLTKVALISTNTSAAGVVVRGATSGDGLTATAITATAGATIWQQYGMRLHTAVGQVLGLDFSLLPTTDLVVPLTLLQGQALLVQVVAALTTSNPATNHWVVNCAWKEVAI